MVQKMVSVPAKEYEEMKIELERRRLEALHARLSEAEKNLEEKKFTRADLGF